MTVADKLLQVNQVKQDIKTAIETKGVPMTDVAFTEYANKILDISSGAVVDEYFDYAKDYYTRTNNATLFLNAWQDMKDLELFDIPLTLAAPNQDLGGFIIDLYVGTNGQLQALYDACVNETIPPPIDLDNPVYYYVNNVASPYAGDIGDFVGFPIPLYCFGNFLFNLENDSTLFLIGDLTPLSMGLGLVLAKIVNVSIPNNNIVIQQGFEFENENGIIIPNGITTIRDNAFRDWTSNNQPLVIPDSVTDIGHRAFSDWTSNNQPLVIPNSVTSIGEYAFAYWSANNQPLVIPESVTSIGEYAFWGWEVVPYVEIQAITPLTLGDSSIFGGQDNASIYVPDESLDAYKTATNWASLASRIFPISDKPITNETDEYFYYSKTYYTITRNSTLFSNAWRHSLTIDASEISVNSLQATPRGKAQYPNGEIEGVIIPHSVRNIGNYAFAYWSANNLPLVIPNRVRNIRDNAFRDWTSNNQPLVISNRVLSIGFAAFSQWSSNNKQLLIPNSVTTIGTYAFYNWTANNQPLVIPESVMSIGEYAFWGWEVVPYVEIQAITPPTIAGATAFLNQNDAPIYVPDASVDDYKTATNWADLADRIFSINDK